MKHIGKFVNYTIKEMQMAYQIKNNQGTLFSATDKKTTDKHPDYTGSCKINDVKMNISAWVNESQAGKRYLRLKFDEYKPKSDATYEYTTTSSETADLPL